MKNYPRVITALFILYFLLSFSNKATAEEQPLSWFSIMAGNLNHPTPQSVNVIHANATAYPASSPRTYYVNEASPEEEQNAAFSGSQFRLGAIFPKGDGYAGAPGPGILFDITYWFETVHFAIEPRVGIRFDAVRGEDSYFEIPIDIGAFFLFGAREFKVMFGGGAGVHHIWETRGYTVVAGNVLPSKIEHLTDDSGWGFASYGRLGVLFAPNHRVRLTITGEYNVTWIELNGQKYAKAFTAGIGFIF